MLYIAKNAINKITFDAIVDGLELYEDLKDNKRASVMDLLGREQGGLCPCCERSLNRIGATIEHFYPKAVFPQLQLDYHNLYLCCTACNNPKGNFLVPAYIFDKRFDARSIDYLFE